MFFTDLRIHSNAAAEVRGERCPAYCIGGGCIPGKAFGLEARVYGVELDLGGIMRLQAGLGFGFGV